MNNDELERLFWDAAKTSRQHRISLDFERARCGKTVAMTMQPASPPNLPWPIYMVGCGCMGCGYTADPEMTPERWADIVRGSKKGEDDDDE